MSQNSDKSLVSVLLPVYNEAKNLPELHRRLSEVAAKVPDCEFEFLFVDDCSKDETRGVLDQLREDDPRVETIRFARNCGSHAAVAAGLDACRGDAAVMLAGDLQDPPEIIPGLLEKWRSGAGVVWGVREKREGEPLMTRISSRIFYFLMNRLTDVYQPPTGADVFLLDRSVIRAFRGAPEKNISVYMLIAWLGFPQESISYVKEARKAGTSKWTTSMRIKLFFDSLISFSYIPLRFMGLVGSGLAVMGLLYGLMVFINALRGGITEGWSSLMIVILVIGGIQMILMSLLGEYLWRTFDETRGRPRYVVENSSLEKDERARE